MLVVAKTPFVGSWIVDNLVRHGDALNDGILYPMPHRLEEGLRAYEAHTEGGRARTTQQRRDIRGQARGRVPPQDATT